MRAHRLWPSEPSRIPLRGYDDLDAIELRARHIRPMDMAAIRGVLEDRGLLAIVEKAEQAVAGALEVLSAAERRAAVH